MPEINPQLPQVPDNAWKDVQFRFDGRWIPDVDGALIGPGNYQELQNLRYKDSGIEGVNGYSKINTAALDGTGAHSTLGDFPKIRNGGQLRSNYTQDTYTLVHSINDSDQGRVFVNRTAIGSQGAFDTSNKLDVSGNPYFEDASTGLEGRFSKAPQGHICYANGEDTVIFGGDEQPIAAAFLVDDGHLVVNPTYPIDYTDVLSNNNSADYITLSTATEPYLLLMTTRPIQGIKFYITAAGGNSETDLTTKVYEWDGSAWNELTVDASDTEVGGAELAQTGSITFDHTKSTVKLKHYEELYLYAYLIELTEGTGTAASAEVYSMTVDTAMQSLENVWDGVYRQPVQVQFNQTATGAPYSDYTAQVNVESDEDNPVGLQIHGMTSGGEILIMTTEPMAGLRMQMLGKFVEQDTNSPTLTIKYWDGDSYVDTSATDNTNAFQQSGIIYWETPSDEQPRTLFNTFGYVYQITTSATLDGVSDGTNNRIYVDLITGVPASEAMGSYKFTALYGTRLMLCAPTIENEGNRIDFSAANAPDVFNGADSSDNGNQSLYFGGSQNITAATGLYNRFGSNIFSMFLVLKDSETYLLVGDTPDEFTIYPVSTSIGCPAPLTLATGEVNLSRQPTEGTTRNIAMWLSSSGPIMFDGASLSAVRGLENFFDPNSDDYVEWDAIARARGWIDNAYKEYNLLIPSSESQTENNRWLVYDLLRRKWFEKDPVTASMPQAAWEVVDSSGQRFNYAGIDDGYMLQLESGTSWAGTGITQRVKTGDFFPSSNIWDETTVRKFKLLTNKFEDITESNTLNIYYYENTEELIGSGISWVDSGDLTGVAVSFEDTSHVEWAATSVVSINVNQDIGSKRVINMVVDENRTAWAHAYEFEITTTNVPRGFRPIAWGVRYRINRKDDQATQ